MYTIPNSLPYYKYTQFEAIICNITANVNKLRYCFDSTYYFIRYFLNCIGVIHSSTVIWKGGSDVHRWFLIPIRKKIVEPIMWQWFHCSSCALPCTRKRIRGSCKSIESWTPCYSKVKNCENDKDITNIIIQSKSGIVCIWLSYKDQLSRTKKCVAALR